MNTEFIAKVAAAAAVEAFIEKLAGKRLPLAAMGSLGTKPESIAERVRQQGVKPSKRLQDRALQARGNVFQGALTHKLRSGKPTAWATKALTSVVSQRADMATTQPTATTQSAPGKLRGTGAFPRP